MLGMFRRINQRLEERRWRIDAMSQWERDEAARRDLDKAFPYIFTFMVGAVVGLIPWLMSWTCR